MSKLGPEFSTRSRNLNAGVHRSVEAIARERTKLDLPAVAEALTDPRLGHPDMASIARRPDAATEAPAADPGAAAAALIAAAAAVALRASAAGAPVTAERLSSDFDAVAKAMPAIWDTASMESAPDPA